MKGSRNNDRTQRERLKFLISVALTPLIGVGIGWIVLQFA